MSGFKPVGKILVAGGMDSHLEVFRAELRHWLSEKGWGEQVSLEESSLESPANRVELALIPGEYQSNGPRHFRFEKIPSLQDVGGLLESWLLQVE